MDKYPEVFRIAKGIEGTIAGFGIHAAGILVSPEPLSEIAPLHATTDHGAAEDGPKKVTATQFTMADVERLGLIKFDVLGLSTLTAINWACKLIKEEHGVDIDWGKIPLDDKETFELLNSGKTDGCFQVENYGMKECLKMIGMDSFDDLVVAVAMYRPGPKDYIPEFAGGGIPEGYHQMPDGSLMADSEMPDQYAKGGRNFKSTGAYKKWLAYGHASGGFAKTPGHQKVSIQGRSKKVQHEDGGYTIPKYQGGGTFPQQEGYYQLPQIYRQQDPSTYQGPGVTQGLPSPYSSQNPTQQNNSFNPNFQGAAWQGNPLMDAYNPYFTADQQSGLNVDNNAFSQNRIAIATGQMQPNTSRLAPNTFPNVSSPATQGAQGMPGTPRTSPAIPGTR